MGIKKCNEVLNRDHGNWSASIFIEISELIGKREAIEEYEGSRKLGQRVQPLNL